MTPELKRFTRRLTDRGWRITSIFRPDDLQHSQGLAVDALPPDLTSGIPRYSPPMYARSSVLEDVEEIIRDSNIQAIVEGGHVHFYDPLPARLDFGPMSVLMKEEV